MGRRLGTTLSAVLVCILLLAFSIPQAKSLETPTGWSKTYGGTDDDRAFSAVQTTDGEYALAGHTETFGVGGSDCYLVKTNASGNPQWSKTYGGTGDDYADAVVQTSDGGYALAGYADYGYVPGPYVSLVKTDSAGNLQWNKTYTGPNWNTGNSVVQTSDGAYAIAGFTYSDAGYYDVYFIKTDTELGLAQTDSTEDTITLYRGETDPYWNFVRVRIWKPKTP
jgi:hypothetical protein